MVLPMVHVEIDVEVVHDDVVDGPHGVVVDPSSIWIWYLLTSLRVQVLSMPMAFFMLLRVQVLSMPMAFFMLLRVQVLVMMMARTLTNLTWSFASCVGTMRGP